MENSFELHTNPEKAEKIPQVVLHFFRHAEPERTPGKPNWAFELTEAGRHQALEKGKTIGAQNPNQAVAFGSPRKRSQHTSTLIMAGGSPDNITGDESLEELKSKIDADIKVGSKIGVDSLLDFHLDKNTPFGREMHEAVFTRKDYLKFLVERSDSLAIETNDQLASTYSRQASDIAKIIKKYVSVSNQWAKLVESGKYGDAKLERFLGSHGGVVESFLLKVIEKTKGINERNRLLDTMPNQFDYTEGIDITINHYKQSQTIHILFKKEHESDPAKNFVFDEDIPTQVIDKIIGEKT